MQPRNYVEDRTGLAGCIQVTVRKRTNGDRPPGGGYVFSASIPAEQRRPEKHTPCRYSLVFVIPLCSKRTIFSANQPKDDPRCDRRAVWLPGRLAQKEGVFLAGTASLISQRFNRIQVGRFPCRINTKQQPDGARNTETDHDPHGGQGGGQADGKEVDRPGNHSA